MTMQRTTQTGSTVTAATIIPSKDVAVVVMPTPRVISEKLILLEAMFDDDDN